MRIDCKKYRWRKAVFFIVVLRYILKFRYTVQIQLTTHTINSLEGLIRLVYYQVTLGTGLQQVKKLDTPLVRDISLIFNEFRAASL